MNSKTSTYYIVLFASWVDFAAYALYDLVYSGAVIYVLLLMPSRSASKSRSSQLTQLGLGALLHALFSIVGIFRGYFAAGECCVGVEMAVLLRLCGACGLWANDGLSLLCIYPSLYTFPSVSHTHHLLPHLPPPPPPPLQLSSAPPTEHILLRRHPPFPQRKTRPPSNGHAART